MFAVIGCPRSGTKYTALVLRQLGYDVGHEEPGSDGVVSWKFIDIQADVMVHQVRNPLDTMGSLTTINGRSWQYICQHIPVKLSWSLDRRCSETWLYWNRMAEARATLTYRIESLPQLWREWCCYLGVAGNYKAIKNIPVDTHHRAHANWTWERVERATPLVDEIKRMAKIYGYE